MKTARIAIAAAIGLALSTTPTLARSASVTFADLDLTTSQGRSILEKRLEVAAREACEGNFTTTGTILPSAVQKKCISQARRQSREQLAQILGRAGLGG